MLKNNNNSEEQPFTQDLISKQSLQTEEGVNRSKTQQLGPVLTKAYLAQQLGPVLTKAYLEDLENSISNEEDKSLEEQYPMLSGTIEEYYYNAQIAQQTEGKNLNNAQEKILQLMLKVFEKLGEKTLKKISENQDIAMSTTIFELLGHCFNKLCRLFGRGSEFSNKEAREAIEDYFGLHDPRKTFFGFDNNTRFALLAKSEGIIMQEESESAESPERDCKAIEKPHLKVAERSTPPKRSECNINEGFTMRCQANLQLSSERGR